MTYHKIKLDKYYMSKKVAIDASKLAEKNHVDIYLLKMK